jgi:hypothetical protein
VKNGETVAQLRCTRCGITKPAADFQRNVTHLSTGLQSRCKSCLAEIRKLATAEEVAAKA